VNKKITLRQRWINIKNSPEDYKMLKTFCKLASMMILSIFLIIIFGKIVFSVNEENLFHYYDFNENTSSSVTDYIHGINFNLINSPLWVNGINGSAIEFDGNSQYLSNTSALSWDGMTSISISWWQWHDNSGLDGLIQHCIDDNDWFIQSNYGSIRVEHKTSGYSDWFQGNTSETLNSWESYVFIFNGSESRLYKNTELIGLNTNYNGYIIDSGTNFYIGKDMCTNNYGDYWDGKIDELGVWYNYSLTTNEIEDIYNGWVYDYNSPPKAGNITSPSLDEIVTKTFNISWEAFTDSENDTINYTVYLNDTIIYQGLDTSFLFNSSLIENPYQDDLLLNFRFDEGTGTETYDTINNIQCNLINNSFTTGYDNFGIDQSTGNSGDSEYGVYCNNTGLSSISESVLMFCGWVKTSITQTSTSLLMGDIGGDFRTGMLNPNRGFTTFPSPASPTTLLGNINDIFPNSQYYYYCMTANSTTSAWYVNCDEKDNKAQTGLRTIDLGNFNLGSYYTSPPVYGQQGISGYYDEIVLLNSTFNNDTCNYFMNLENKIIFYNGNYSLNVTGFDGTSYNSTKLDNFYIDNSPPEINVTYPASYEWINDLINGTCEDISEIINVTINDTNFIFNTSFNYTNWQFDYIGNESLEDVQVNISCIDNLSNIGSKVHPFNIDIISPKCSPLLNYTYDYNSSHSIDENCTDDLNLFSLDIQCLGGSNYNFYAENLNTTLYNHVDNITNMLNDTTCYWVTKDAHTKNNIRNDLNKNNVIKENGKIKIKSNNPNKEDLEIISTHHIVDEMNLDYSKEDKIRFNYKISKKNKNKNIKEKRTFYVNGNNNVFYYKSNKYKAWMVVDNTYWVDFNLRNDKNADYYVHKINKNTYQIDIDTVKEELNFSSIGVLNTNNQTQVFTINPYVPPSEEPDVNLSINITVQNGGVSSEDWEFFILVLIFITLFILCIVINYGSIIHILTAVYGIYLSIHTINNGILEGFLGLSFAIIGLVAVIIGLQKNKGNNKK